MSIMPYGTLSAQRRAPAAVIEDTVRIAADGDRRLTNPLLRATLARIGVDQLDRAAAALDETGGGTRG